MRLTIDHKHCMMSGQCAYMQPDLFKLDDAGSPTVLVGEPQGAQIAQAQDAVEMCPGQAISLGD